MGNSTEMLNKYQNPMLNVVVVGHKAQENNYSDSSNAVCEHDSEDDISGLGSDYSYSFEFSDKEITDDFPDSFNFAGRDQNEDSIKQLNCDESLSSDLPHLNLLIENKSLNLVGDNLTKYSNNKQNANIYHNSTDFMPHVYDKNGPSDERELIEDIDKEQTTNDFQNGVSQKTSGNVNFRGNSEVRSDIYKNGDDIKMYIQEVPTNETYEFDLFPNKFNQNNCHQDVYIADFTRGKKKKNMYLFRNVCYFNLVSKCNRSPCAFPHTIPDVSKVKLQLKHFPDYLLIEDYDLIKDKKIKFDYGLCFLEECSKRHLSKEVVRMAVDFINISNNEADVHFQSVVLKATLLHLNNANLHEFSDLLKSVNFPERRCLWDILLETISVTDHFLDYKEAFIKLIDMIIPKAFSIKITTDILKQICKIPFEATLSRAIMKIIKYTHPLIFQEPLVHHFENMIQHDKELISHLKTLKSANAFSMNATKTVSTLINYLFLFLSRHHLAIEMCSAYSFD